MSNTLNGTSPFPGNSWNIYNVVNVIGPLNNKMVIYGNASPSALNLGSNIDASGNLYSNGNLKLPYGTTANRPIPAQGFFRFNTSQTLIEYYNGNTWLNLVNSLTPTTPPTITITNPNGVATTYTWNSSFATYTFSFVNANFSTYTITVTGPCTGLFTLNGAGGGGGNQTAPGVTPSAGASGGRTIGTFVMTPGNTYYLLVGQGGTSVPPETTNTIVPIGGGGLTALLGYAGQGGGFTGLFLGPIILGSATTTSVTAGNNSNAIMMAGGGGGGAAEFGTTIGGQGGGIVGGNAAPQLAPGTEPGGGGGIWNGIGTIGGAGGAAYGQPNPGNPGPPSLAGVQMQGGIPANSGDLGGGGGGGGGYYGGGGGTGENTPSGTGGGGGCGFFSTAVESPTTTTGAGAAGGPGYTNGTNGSATLAFVN
jgi:hypothetical protein